MYPITASEYSSKVEPIFNSIFANENPFGEPFKPEISCRLLLFGFRYGLNNFWLKAFVNAIDKVNEGGFYLSILSNQRPDFQVKPSHWYVSLNTADKYIDNVYTFENAIYSASGTWGLICSDEDHAIVGGTQQFIDEIRKHIQDVDSQVNLFLQTWKHYNEINKIDVSWVLPQLTHVFGFEKAKRLIEEENLGWLLKDN